MANSCTKTLSVGSLAHLPASAMSERAGNRPSPSRYLARTVFSWLRTMAFQHWSALPLVLRITQFSPPRQLAGSLSMGIGTTPHLTFVCSCRAGSCQGPLICIAARPDTN